MRNIAFSLTSDAIRNRTKTVTRRLGWNHLEPGTVLQAIVKGQGLKKGEHVEKLAVIRVVSVTDEHLSSIEFNYGPDETTREGFPDLTACQFVTMFARANNCTAGTWVNRIAFEYVDAD